MTKERIDQNPERKVEFRKFPDPAEHDIFTAESQPFRNNEEVLIAAHASEVRYEIASQMWAERNIEMDKTIDRSDSQVIIVDPSERNVTNRLLEGFNNIPVSQIHVGSTEKEPFNDHERNIWISNEVKSSHAYIVASLNSPEAYSTAEAVAFQLKFVRKVPFTTLVATYLGEARQDKNATKSLQYTGNALNIAQRMHSLSHVFDAAIAVEPHSYAAQGYAANFGLPLAPVSPWKEVTNRLFQEIWKRDLANPYKDREGLIIAGPDIGRNMAAKRISQEYKIKMVSGNKARISETQTEIQFPQEQSQYIDGRFAFCYDDEVASFGTGETLMHALEDEGAIGFAMAGVHTKLTNEWDRIMQNPSLEFLLLTDSRTPVCDQESINACQNKIVFHSLAPFIRRLIEMDIRGTNPWEDQQYSPMILQERK